MQIKEILVLHHSHLDIGYTHSQPILWEMQREYIDLALDFLDQTADFPEHSLPRWTCEMTSPVVRWLGTATPTQVERFTSYVREGRIGISAMEYNTTPSCNAEQLARQLYVARDLRERFGVPISTLNQHDVNGIPWPMVDLMIDDGIELFTMAINNHFGGQAAERPRVFRWEGPSGRSMFVMNGAHYTMFDQLLYAWENSVPRMREGLNEYLAVLETMDYPHDFIYLTSTNTPALWDNSPPNMDVARLVRSWNEQGNDPPIRYVTPAMLLERIKQVPQEQIPLHRGDWTDYWNFGAGSTAWETALNRRAKPALFGAELLHAVRPVEPRVDNPVALADVSTRAWEHLNLYDEHTWGSWDTENHDHPHTRTQSQLKTINAYHARELADYLLVNELEALAGNVPQTSGTVGGVLLVNPTATERQHYVAVPDNWREPGKRLRSNLFQYHNRYDRVDAAPRYGPITVPAYSWVTVPLDALQAPQVADAVAHGPTEDGRGRYIESPFHRLEFDAVTGRITRLYDKQRAWEVLSANSAYTFFEFIHERTDPLFDNRREAIYDRDGAKEKFDISCWRTDWHAVRARADVPLGYSLEETTGGGVTLVLRFAAPSVEGLEQRVTLHADSDVIDLEGRFTKLDVRRPEALYFVFPLDLPADWRCHFDTAGVTTELDHEQIARSCRDWVTVDSYAALHAGERGATLYCPDAPLVQAGDFNFGRKHDAIPRDAAPLLLAWPLNNYWNTNFPVTQPGHFVLRYAFQTHGAFDPVAATTVGERVASPVLQHPVWHMGDPQEGQLIVVGGAGVRLLHVKPATDWRGTIARVVNLGASPVDATIALPSRPITAAHWTTPTELDGAPLTVADGTAQVRLEPRRITTVRLM